MPRFVTRVAAELPVGVECVSLAPATGDEWAEVGAEMSALIRSRASWIVDAAALTELEERGLGVLLAARERAREVGGDLLVAGLPERGVQVIEMAGLQRNLPSVATVDAAVARFTPHA